MIPLLLFLALLGLIAFISLMALLARMGSLERRLQALERAAAEREGGAAPAGLAPGAGPTPAALPQAAVHAPLSQSPAMAPTPGAAPSAVPPGPAPPPAGGARPEAAAAPIAPPLPSSAPARSLDVGGLEDLVGGVWLQNVGAVLLLLGVFLMILWGYTSHRLGPMPLVVAGVLLGATLAWRGDRVARRTRPFGHALIGIGIGVVYVTLYLGYVRLHVLPAPLALSLLAAVSLASMVAGLRYGVQLIAALGVVGAFLPQFMAAWLRLPGFALEPWALLAYLAVIDGLVFALAARAGWSALDLTALVLGALAWIAAVPGGRMDWPLQAGLAALFTLLGVAPTPRLTRIEGRVRPIDLAVVAVAPLCLLAASAPFLEYASREGVGILLFTLAGVQLAVALWVDARRPERDLWVPLTGAATLYFTAGLARWLGPERTPVAWTLEGAILITLGLRPRGGWLRACGSVLLLVGSVWMFVRLAMVDWLPGEWPVLYAAGLRNLACVVTVLAAGALLARGREKLTSAERATPEFWTVVGNLLLFGWLTVEAGHVASAWLDPGAGANHLPPPVGIPLAGRREAFAMALRAALWGAQAAALAWRGTRPFGGALRACAYLVGFVALAVVWSGVWADPWWLDQHPVLHAGSLFALLAVALVFALSLRLARHRAALATVDRRAPEVAAALAGFTLAIWSARVAGHVARATLGADGLPGEGLGASDAASLRTLTSAFTSAAWLAEAVGLLVVGWLRASAFLRWCGLALLGITLLKFLLFDLQTVDVFWRFLTAIVVGAAMLALSYAYQRRKRGGSAAP